MVQRVWIGVIAALVLMVGSARAQERPNIVLILADDVGFLDFGTYGGEAATPNIDALAARGALFTNYRTSPLCAPSRAMLLTGIDNHRTGVATIPEVLPPEHRGQPGYSLHLEPGVATVAAQLREAGYQTYMTGKWHLGHGDGHLPVDQGFDRSFILDASGADNWEDKTYIPYYRQADWFEDGERASLPEDFYSSEFLVDRMIDYIDAGEDDAPFFAHVAFQAVHIPVQAPREFTAKYEGVYDVGWHAIRQARWETAQARGFIPEGAPLADMPDSFRDWSDLTEEDRAWFSKAMAVHAGMLEAMDHHIGRLVAHIEARGELENTLFIVTSDNGPEPSWPVGDPNAGGFAAWGMQNWLERNGYNRDLETLGEKGSYVFIGPEWAMATAAPGDLFKFYATEGGTRVPMVIAGPGIARTGQIDALSFVTDIAPTLLDMAGVEPTLGEVEITGRSLAPVLAAQARETYPFDAPVGMEVSGNAALYKGDYKITRSIPPRGDNEWRLYNIARDPGETQDLSAAEPEKFGELLADYDAYAQEMGVLPMPEGYESTRQIISNMMARQLGFYWWILAIIGVVFAGLLYVLVRLGMRLFR
ncbi:MAG: arylsulfatase [Pseudomonadota bacterium]